MSLRLANYRFLIEKLRPAPLADGADALVMLLENVLTPLARRRFGGPAADRLAEKAAQRGKDLALACRSWFVATEGAFNLLRAAAAQDARFRSALALVAQKEAAEAGRRPDEDAPAPAEAPVAERAARQLSGDWPDWLTALLDLLCLTRPAWAYLRLYPDRAWGWKGRLTAHVWGPGHNQCALTRELASLASLVVDLGQAWAAVRNGGPPDGPLQSLLTALDGAARAAAFAEEDHGPLARVLHAAPDDPAGEGEVAEALARLKSLRNHPGESTLAAAWAALRGPLNRRTEEPPQALIDALAAQAAGPARPPKEVLTGLLACQPAPGQARAATGQDVRGDLVEHLFASVPPGSPEESVLCRLTAAGGDTFDALRPAVSAHPPGALSAGLLSAALVRLCGWRQALEGALERARTWTPRAEPPSSMELLDLPRAAEQPELLAQAAQVVGGWLAGAPRAAWADLAAGVREAVRGAVLSACLERLCVLMDAFYRQTQQPTH
jgi:hypothetical protein